MTRLRLAIAIIACAGTAACGSAPIELARVRVIQYEASDKYDSVAGGGFDESAFFGRFEVKHVPICRDRFTQVVTKWAGEQGLTASLLDPTQFTSTVHVLTRDPIEYFELTYWADANAKRVKITVSVIDAKGNVLAPRAYAASYGLKDLDTNLRNVLKCES